MLNFDVISWGQDVHHSGWLESELISWWVNLRVSNWKFCRKFCCRNTKRGKRSFGTTGNFLLSSHSLAKLGHTVILGGFIFLLFFLAAVKTKMFWSNKYEAHESCCCVFCSDSGSLMLKFVLRFISEWLIFGHFLADPSTKYPVSLAKQVANSRHPINLPIQLVSPSTSILSL